MARPCGQIPERVDSRAFQVQIEGFDPSDIEILRGEDTRFEPKCTEFDDMSEFVHTA